MRLIHKVTAKHQSLVTS